MISAVLKKAGHEVIFLDMSRFSEEGQKNTTADALKAQIELLCRILNSVFIIKDNLPAHSLSWRTKPDGGK